MKKKCCKSYKKKGKACSSCPLVAQCCEEELLELVRKIKKKKSREKFIARYIGASA